MIRKTILTLVLFLGGNLGVLSAQNIQLHYDFGHSLYGNELSKRPKITSTIEKFHPDSWGSTFFFVDMDYTSDGVLSAYWEIARELQFWKGPLSAHLEYNGGVAKGFSYHNAYLLGATYTYNNTSFTRGFTFTPMYKYIQKHQSPNNFQLTATWYMNFCEHLYTFCGFADWWREETGFGNTIFLSEPQFWINLNKLKNVNDKFRLSVGTEVKVSTNFVGDGLYAIPTFALKWTIN